MAIKVSLGKLGAALPYEVFVTQQLTLNSIQILSIQVAHLAVVSTLAFHHRDPFDRLLIAQSMVEHLPIVSSDSTFDAYPVQRLW